MAKYIIPTVLMTVSMSLLSGCVTQSYENNEPVVKTQANRDEMAATRVSLGLGYLKMGDMSQAKLNLEKAKRFSPNLVQVHAAFAHYYETVGEGTLAVESFEQALSIKADSADTLNNYGVFLCRQGNVAAAEKQFLKAIAVPSYLLVSQSYENLASCYLQNDNFEKAEMYLDKAISHSPNRTPTLLQMVRLQYAMGDYKEGKRYLQRFERNTQRFTADSLALAYKLYWKLGQRRTASNYANMLVKMYPQSWEGKQYLLNELEFIEADNLARKYQTTQKESHHQSAPNSNKRVVKLSPKKSVDSSFTNSNKSVVAPTSIAAKSVTSPVTDAAAMTTNLGTGAIQTTTSTSAALVATTAAGAAAIVDAGNTANKTANSLTLTNASDIEQPKTIVKAPVEQQEVTKEVVSNAEPTSTQPIPAKRDAPLPEALSAPVEEAKVTTLAQQSNTAEQVAKPVSTKEEMVATKSVDTPVTPAEQDNAAVTTDAIEDNVATDTSLGQTPSEDVAAIETANSAKQESIETAKVSQEEALHTVTPGENLYNISVKYNVKLKALRKWNDISEKNKIRIGDKLYVVDPQTVKNINE